MKTGAISTSSARSARPSNGPFPTRSQGGLVGAGARSRRIRFIAPSVIEGARGESRPMYVTALDEDIEGGRSKELEHWDGWVTG
jgi:hypothetical protein